MVVWLIGISGSGKTTLGNKLYDYYTSNNIPSYILDGDLIRNFYDNDLTYTKEDRITNIKRIMLAAYVLEKNNIIPIVCNISPFESLRKFARKKFFNYQEIFLKKDLTIAQKNDIKDIYKIHKESIVGIDIPFERPINSDLILEVDRESIESSFKILISYLSDKTDEL
jgi:adenylylsulfate kinase